jgi:hypothetical protein
MCQICLETCWAWILENIRRYIRGSFASVLLERSRDRFAEFDDRELVRILDFCQSLEDFLLRLCHIYCRVLLILKGRLLSIARYLRDVELQEVKFSGK